MSQKVNQSEQSTAELAKYNIWPNVVLSKCRKERNIQNSILERIFIGMKDFVLWDWLFLYA